MRPTIVIRRLFHRSPQGSNQDRVSPQLVATPLGFPEIDVLLTQGMKDTLFNFNDAWRNFECLKSRGGDVRLLTHQTGHRYVV